MPRAASLRRGAPLAPSGGMSTLALTLLALVLATLPAQAQEGEVERIDLKPEDITIIPVGEVFK